MYIIPAEEEELNNLVHNLRALRRRHGLSLRRMAEILHTSVYVVRMLERGQISNWLGVESIFYAGWYFHMSAVELLRKRV